jgi:hypothetical protein
MAHGVVKLTDVLTSLASGGHHGESCAHPGAASRVLVWELLVWSPFVHRLEGSTDGRPEAAQRRAWRCIVSWVPTVPGMTLQCLGRQHSGGNGRTGLEVTGETHLAGLTSRRRPR